MYCGSCVVLQISENRCLVCAATGVWIYTYLGQVLTDVRCVAAGVCWCGVYEYLCGATGMNELVFKDKWVGMCQVYGATGVKNCRCVEQMCGVPSSPLAHLPPPVLRYLRRANQTVNVKYKFRREAKKYPELRHSRDANIKRNEHDFYILGASHPGHFFIPRVRCDARRDSICRKNKK